MTAPDRCVCSCTDGCISGECECKLATLRLFCSRHGLTESAAFQQGYPKTGWYKDDLLQALDTPLPFQDQIQIFECCKGMLASCSC